MAEKAPAFQFYPRDFLTDEEVRIMSHTERGIYITLLCFCWIEGSLPGDVALVARLVSVPSARMRKIWSGPLGNKFALVDGRYRNRRLDAERQKQDIFRKRQADAAAERWHKSGNADALPTQCSSSSICDLQSASSEDQDISSAPLPATEPVILTYPTNGSQQEWFLVESQLAEWSALYPGVDVLSECRKALAWIRANTRKTAKGMPRFLTNWLNRATDRRGGQAVGVTKQTASLVEASKEFLRGDSHKPDAA